MPKAEVEELERVHLYLFKSDVEWIKSVYGTRMPFTRAARSMIRAVRKKVEARAEQESSEASGLTLADLREEEVE